MPVQQVQTESLAPGGASSWRDRLMENQESETLMFTGSDGKPKIAITDIQEELDFSQNCICLRHDPPLKVIDGFFKRVWGKFEFERVVMVEKGLFLTHFTSKADRQRALESATIFFDKHPVVVRKWNSETNLSQGESTDCRCLGSSDFKLNIGVPRV